MSIIEEILEGAVANLGVTLPDLILIVVSLLALLYFARDFKLGIVIYFVLAAFCYVAFSLMDWAVGRSISLVFAILVVMALSVYISKGKVGVV